MGNCVRHLLTAGKIGSPIKFCPLLILGAIHIHAATYSSLNIPQNTSVQIGTPSENLYLAMQGDGNLVLYQNGTALWSTGTFGQNCSTNQCRATLQPDGNFAVYNGSTALWNSGTANNPGAYLVLSDQLPHIEIFSSGQSLLWANAYTFSAGNFSLHQGASATVGSTVLIMQPDGNLVLYQISTNAPLWNSGSTGQNCGANQCYAAFQPDGNFVIYNGSTAIWNSQTAGNAGAQLLLSSAAPYVQILGTLTSHYPAKEYIYVNGQAIAIENP